MARDKTGRTPLFLGQLKDTAETEVGRKLVSVVSLKPKKQSFKKEESTIPNDAEKCVSGGQKQESGVWLAMWR